MMTIRAQKARSLDLTKNQQEIVIGSLLGDGYLARTTCGYAFRVNHSIAQKAYVDWKYEKLQEFTNSGPKCYQKSYYFRTITHPFFASLREEFYSNQVKIIPEKIDTLITPLILAVLGNGRRCKRWITIAN